MRARIRNIVLPIVEITEDSFCTYYDRRMSFRCVRYGWILVGTGFLMWNAGLSPISLLMTVLYFHLLYEFERSFIIIKVLPMGFGISTGYLFSSKKEVLLSFDEIHSVQFLSLIGRVRIKRNEKKSVFVMAGLPPTMGEGERSLKQFLEQKLEKASTIDQLTPSPAPDGVDISPDEKK